jgi:hypothetical protein
MSLDLTPLLRSVCDQSHRYVDVIVLAAETNGLADKLRPFSEQLAARGSVLVLATHRDHGTNATLRSFSSLEGDYICFPDPECILEPEFASTMAHFLETAPEYGAVRCNGLFVHELDPAFPIGRVIDVSRPHEGSIFESLLLKETSINICSWMVRRAVLEQANVTRVSLDPARWDWQFTLPLAHGNRVGFLNGELFRLVHQLHGPMQTTLTRYNERTRFEAAFFMACLEILECLPTSEAEKDIWRRMVNLVSIKTRINTDNAFRLWFNFLQYRDDLSKLLETCGGSPRGLEVDSRWLEGLQSIRLENAMGLLTYFYSDLLIQVLRKRISQEAAQRVLRAGFGIFRAVSSGRRFCLYGGGAAARDILPWFLALGLRPQCIWDRAAKPGQTLLGTSVTRPDFTSISQSEREDLEVIVAIGYRDAAVEVKKLLREQGFHNVIHVSEPQGARIYLQDLITAFLNGNSHPFWKRSEGISHES